MHRARAAIATITTSILVGAVSSIGAAGAATTGVGTSQVGTTVARVQVGANGSVLGIRIMADDARSTIDSKVASTAEAFSRFTSVATSSDVVADVNRSSGAVESKQPGGQATVTTGTINLNDPKGDGTVPIPTSVLTGTIGLAQLTSEAGATAAKAAVTATLTNASAAGGLVSIAGVTSALNTAAVSTQSDGTRSVKIDQVVAVDLGSLLAGIGLAVGDLPVPTATALLTTLNTTVQGLGGATGDQVNALIDDLQVQITDLTDAINAGATALPGTLTTIVDVINGTPLGTVIDQPTVTDISVQPVADQLDELLDLAQGALADVLGSVMQTLDGAPLVKVDSIEVGVTTKAADTVANSTHGVTGSVNGISVGSLASKSISVTDAAATVNAAVADLNGQVKDALEGVDPALGSLVTIDPPFARPATKGVTDANGYVRATDGVTGLRISITPPAALAAVVDDIKTQAGIADEIAGAGETPPAVSTAMATLGTTLNNDPAPLSDPTTITLADITDTSDFAAQVAGGGGGGGNGTTGDDGDRGLLAATGSNDAVPMTGMALLLIALGLGFREWVRMPAPARVRSRE